MDSQIAHQLEPLRSALTELPATGAHGFEGLIAATLTSICGQPFRLASSGSQRGRDGDSAFDDGATRFEAKRYDGAIPFESLATKLMELSADDHGHVDTWICGATTTISAQHVDRLSAFGQKQGIGVVVLDWNDSGLPPLALALAMAGEPVKAFLRTNLQSTTDADTCNNTLELVEGSSDFSSQALALRNSLCDANVSFAGAKTQNRRYLESVFSCRAKARLQFGQPLAPRDPQTIAFQPREALRAVIEPLLTGAPDGKLLVVLGSEGSGKSWAVADSWLDSDSAPLLSVVTAEAIERHANPEDIEEFLIDRLIRQTAAVLSDASRHRWRRRFSQWKRGPAPDKARFVLWVDGLNQSYRYPWATWLDGAAEAIRAVGGRLIVTTRSVHFEQFRHELESPVDSVSVPEWTLEELAAALTSMNISIDELSERVREALRNPRIFGIALELLNKKQIKSLLELSAGRLLFEHLRLAQVTGVSPIGAKEFAKTLQSLGQAISQRLERKDRDDLTAFDASQHEHLQAVCSSRFFHVIDSQNDLYEVRDEGLHLALALWIVDSLAFESRNQRDPFARLGTILEPIAALDVTAVVLATAIDVAIIKENVAPIVLSALIRHFVSLQNPPADYRGAFMSLGWRATGALLQAAEDAITSQAHVGSLSWLREAIQGGRHDPAAWSIIASRVKAWLRRYSRSAAEITNSADAQDKEKRQSEWRSKVEARIAGLTKREREFLNQGLIEVADAELNDLHDLALVLLAGMPLVDFAAELFALAFSRSLLSHPYASNEGLRNLVSLNMVDWQETRDALRRTLEECLGEERSAVGNWTSAGILRATGDSDDAGEAEAMVSELTRDWPKFPGGRWVERYCDVDPCNPGSDPPTAFETTIQEFAALDVSTIRVGPYPTQEDHMFRMVMPALARFSPDTAVALLRRFADQVLDRTGQPRWHGIITIVPHAGVLLRETVSALVTAAQSSTAEPREDSLNKSDWATAQYSLVAALPHLSAGEQMDAIGNLRVRAMLINALELVRPAAEQTVDEWVSRCEQTSDESLQIRIFSALAYSLPPLSSKSKAVISRFITANERHLRTEAIALVARTADPELLRVFAASGWRASACSPGKGAFEIWYGSRALIGAARAGIVNLESLLDRIAFNQFQCAALVLGDDAARLVADRIDAAISKVLTINDLSPCPPVENEFVLECTPHLLLRRIGRDDDNLDVATAFKRLVEPEEEHNRRQRESQEAFERFQKQLSEADADLVLTDLGFKGTAAVLAARPELAGRWYERLMAADRRGKYLLHHFTIQIATALAERQPERAIALMRDARQHNSNIRYLYGHGKVPAESWAIWSQAGVSQFREESIKILAAATNDQVIEIEVLAAQLAGRGDIIEQFVNDDISAGHPARMARAITICGLFDESEMARGVLNFFATHKGFIGNVHEAARYAYDRNQWARHWYSHMRNSETPIDFWRASVLFLKIVDGRFDLWSDNLGEGSEVFHRFFPLLSQDIERRIKKWQDARSKKLFGLTIPNSVYLVGLINPTDAKLLNEPRDRSHFTPIDHAAPPINRPL